MKLVGLLSVVVAGFAPVGAFAADNDSLKETFKNYAKAWDKGEPEKMLSFMSRRTMCTPSSRAVCHSRARRKSRRCSNSLLKRPITETCGFPG